MTAPAGEAVVTGGTGALGRAVVQRLAREGYRVHVPWVVESEALAFQQQLPPATRASVRLYRCDVTGESDVAMLFDQVQNGGQAVKVLANIVGGFVAGPIEETGLADWNRMVGLNATSAFLCCRAAAPGMKRAGIGRIINVSSGPAVNRGAANLAAYSAAKAAVLNLTESLSRELAPWGITVNCIVPSVIDTAANRQANPGADRSTWLKPEEIAEVILFLAGEAGAIVNGSPVILSRGGPKPA